MQIFALKIVIWFIFVGKELIQQLGYNDSMPERE